MKGYLGVDIGTGSMKAAFVTQGAAAIESGSYGEPSIRVPPFQQDVREFALSFQDFCRGMAAKYGFGNLGGIALSSHGPSLICVDRAGAPLGTMVTWQDNGAVEEARELRAALPGFAKDGSSWEAKCLAAWKREGQRIAAFLTPKDYLNYLLTGQLAYDRSTASTVRFVDQSTWVWKDSGLGIPAAAFPRIVDPWEPVGTTGTPYSRDCGLPDGTPVLGGGIDAYCEALGAGAVNPGDVMDGSGTSTCISVCSRGPQGDYHVVPAMRLRIETMSSTGAAIKWIRGIAGDSIGSEPLPRWTPILFHPFLNGERSPYWDEGLRASFVGASGADGGPELYVAVLQGTAFGVRQNVELLERTEDIRGRPIIACGGGAENDAWLRMKANIMNRPYIKPAVKDSAPLGDVCLCGIGDGMRSPLEELGIQTVGSVVEPDADGTERALLDELYSEYLNSVQVLMDTNHRLSSLRKRSLGKHHGKGSA